MVDEPRILSRLRWYEYGSIKGTWKAQYRLLLHLLFGFEQHFRKKLYQSQQQNLLLASNIYQTIRSILQKMQLVENIHEYDNKPCVLSVPMADEEVTKIRLLAALYRAGPTRKNWQQREKQ